MEAAVLIADDHPLFREALKLVALDAMGGDTGILEADCLDAALAHASACRTLELALVDLNMPGMAGVEGVIKLRQKFPSLPLVVVSADERASTIQSVLNAGVSGFIPKSCGKEEMAEAVRLILDGEVYCPVTSGHDTGAMLANDPESCSTRQLLETLTRQERCVLDYIVRGKSNKFVAIELDIAESTVKAHVSSILRKLKVHSRTLAVIKAGHLLQSA